MTISNTVNDLIAAFQSGDSQSAIDIATRILVHDEANSTAHHVLGRISYVNDEYAEANRHYGIVLSHKPDDAGVLYEYGSTFRLMNDYDNAIKYLSRSKSMDSNRLATMELGMCYADMDNFDKAIPLLGESLREKSNCVFTIRRLGKIYKKLRDYKESARYYSMLVKLSPESIHAYPDLIQLCLLTNDKDKAIEYCNKCLELDPACTGVIAYYYVALLETDRAEEAYYIHDNENYIQGIDISTLSKVDNIDKLNTVLMDHIKSHAEKTRTPDMYTTVNGWQTQNGMLFDENVDLGKRFYAIINLAVEEYLKRVPDDENHPLNLSTPTETHIEPWGVVLNRGGHQAPHVHPKSWISGCYYIKVPKTVEEKSGCIQFGHGEEGMHISNEPEILTIKPEAGNVVLFPSFFWHNTVALDVDEERVCIAFDIIPSKGWGK